MSEQLLLPFPEYSHKPTAGTLRLEGGEKLQMWTEPPTGLSVRLVNGRTLELLCDKPTTIRLVVGPQ